jgi:Oxidoreductase-like protein, N-terminal
MTIPEITPSPTTLTTQLAPTSPNKPDPSECCGTGCIPCVMDIYEEALWQYEKDLKAWNLSQTPTSESRNDTI